MNISKTLIKRRKIIVIIWIIAFIVSIPAITTYSNYISYSSSSSSATNTESAIASQILANVSAQNQSLIVLVNEIPYGSLNLVNSTISFQNALSHSGVGNLTSTSSPFTTYADLLNRELLPLHTSIQELFGEANSTSGLIYEFPSAFYSNWSKVGFSKSAIMESAYGAGYNNSSYQRMFLETLNKSISSGNYSTPFAAVEASVYSSAVSAYGNLSLTDQILNYTTLLNYRPALPNFVADLIDKNTSFDITGPMVISDLHSSDPGYYYITKFGLEDAPQSLMNTFVDKNSTAFIVTIDFNSPVNYIYKNGSSPSQSATPKIISLAQEFFGSNAVVTGEGAIAYQTQQVTSSAGIAFALIFVVLAIAVLLTLVSYKASILTLIIVSLATALGYISIFISGFIFHTVNYVVNYTLTAVILGVSTDYLVFVLARFRQELREGKNKDEAVEIAVERAGKAVLVSGMSVAVSLGMFSIVPGFGAWGSVLAISIALTVVMEVSIFPFILKTLGPGIFMKRGMKPLEKDYHRSSIFYKTSDISTRRKFTVVAIILLIAAPAMYFFFTIPTTYDFNTGLPGNLSSVRGLNQLQQDFGANILYPIEVIVPLNSAYTPDNYSNTDLLKLQAMSSFLNETPGVDNIIGPYHNNITSGLAISSFVVDGGHYAYFLVYSDYNPYSDQAQNLVQLLRSNNSIIVGGITSSVIDQKIENQKIYTELAILIVAAIAIILLIAFRSVKYPIISILGVFISISWTTSILYIISNYLLHQALIYLIPIILFVILMSLGNDYSVFIFSRIREEISSHGTQTGIARGMVGSGKVVTSLGLILAASLGVLTFIPSGFLEQLGIAFIVSLLLDTFVIRTFFFPAMLSIFSRSSRQ